MSRHNLGEKNMNTQQPIFSISTQYIENYNHHSDEWLEPYHKFKFGDEYIITGADRMASACAFVQKFLCTSEYEYVCHSEECDWDKMGSLEQSYLDDNLKPHNVHRINIQEYYKANELDRAKLEKYVTKEKFFNKAFYYNSEVKSA